MNSIGKLNHGNYQSTSLGALNNTINTEISGSVEAANNIIGDMATQRKDMLIGLENLQANLIGTKDEKTGERNFDGLIGRAYKNDAIQTAQDTKNKLLGQAKEEYNQKIKTLEQGNNDIRNLIGAKNDAIDTYKNDKSKAILGNDFNSEKEAASQFLMAYTGLDLQTASASWNNGGKNSQVYQQLKSAGFDDNTINQIMSRTNTINNLDKEGQNLANGIVPAQMNARFGQEMYGNLIGKGYTPKQASRLALVGTQNGVTNLYQASSDMEAAANNLRLQPNFKDREAIALENSQRELERHNRRIEAQNDRYLIGNQQQQQQPIDDTQITDEPIQNNYPKILSVEVNNDGKTGYIHTDDNRTFYIDDIKQVKANNENGDNVNLKANSYNDNLNFELDGNVGLNEIHTNKNKNISPYKIRKYAKEIQSLEFTNASPEVINKAYEKLNEEMPFDIFVKNKNGKDLIIDGKKVIDTQKINEYLSNREDGGFFDNRLADIDIGANIRNKDYMLELASNFGGNVDRGDFLTDYKVNTTNKFHNKDKKTWSQLTGNTLLNKSQNQTNSNQTKKLNPFSIIENPQGREAFELHQEAKNGNEEAKQILTLTQASKNTVNSLNPEVAKYVTDDQKMIKDTEIDVEHLNQDSKNQALTIMAVMSSATPQLRTDKKLADKILKALYEMLELERLGKSDGNWSEVFADLKDSLNVKQLSNIGINVTSIEDLGKYFSRKDIKDMIKSGNLEKNMLQLQMYHK